MTLHAHGTGAVLADKEKSKKTQVFWATPEHELVANALGYNTFNKNIRINAEPYFEFTPDAEIAIAIAPADKYMPIPGKFNILFTMWELLDVPPSYVEGINKADALIVPCRFCKDIFSRYFPANRIYVCHLGVDPSIYAYKERKFPNFLGTYECKKCALTAKSITGQKVPCKKCGAIMEEIVKGERFRFLWVGAPNPRKGYPLMLQMVKALESVSTIEIYMKTTMPKMNWWQTIKNAWKKRREIFKAQSGERVTLMRMIRRIPKPYYTDRIVTMGKHKNIFLDTRKLPTNELVDLYHSAHAFALPHIGEGWGLTLCEAMATGCPSISAAETGCKDFFDEKVGYTLKTDILKQDLSETYNLPEARAYVPLTASLLEKMTNIMIDYGKAQKKAKLAADRIRQNFTWELSGKRLRTIVDEIKRDRKLT